MKNNKTKKTFFNIDRKECKLVSEEAIGNAKNHIILAEKLHNSGEYGLGISHLIIGSEEIVKALILHMDSVGFNFRQVKGMKSVFENHQLRYFISFIMFSLSVFLDETNNFLKTRKGGKTGLDLLEEFTHKMTKNEKYKRLMFKNITSKLEFLIDEINWFNGFDLLRQKGFYVDYKEKIETPLSASKSEYLSVKIRVERVYNSIIELISGLNFDNEKNAKTLNNMLETVRKQSIYPKIEKFIKKAKSEKTNPLTYTSNSIQPFLNEIKKEI